LALTVLCHGKKSEKLSLGWTLLSNYVDALFTKEELSSFLSAFLSVLLALNKEASSLPTITIASLVSTCCSTLVDRIFSFTDSSCSSISFEEFGEWYSSEGNKLIPWVELLDLNKWPKPTGEEMNTSDYVTSVLDIHGNGESLSLFPQHLHELRKFALSSGIYKVTPNQLVSALRGSSNSTNKAITLPDLLNILQQLQLQVSSDKAVAFVEALFQQLEFSEAQEGSVSLKLVCTALLVFLHGPRYYTLSNFFVYKQSNYINFFSLDL
jgi:hypothetical protein